jgi:hypothetical protein
MIDTSSSKNQIKEEEDLLALPEDIKLERSISQEDHDKLEKDVEQITHKIVEKSEFLLKMATP